jgi:hypothetical protein
MARYKVNIDRGVMFGGQHFGPGKTLDTDKWELTEADATQIEEWATKGYLETESDEQARKEGIQAAREHAREKVEPVEEEEEDEDSEEPKAKRGRRK